MTEAPTLTAIRVSPPALPLVPAERSRAWMDATNDRFAYRCLPLAIANQTGWWVLNPHPFAAAWDGSPGLGGVRIAWSGPPPEHPYAQSHFGHGILTFRIPYLFRTPPGWHLLATGPFNRPKDSISPLTGITETDWVDATFTMNWQFTRSDEPVRFEAGEPVCQLLPVQLGAIEAFAPAYSDIIPAGYFAWRESRLAHNRDIQVPGSEAARNGWQKHYVRGEQVAGGRAPAGTHRTNVKVRPFAEAEVPA